MQRSKAANRSRPQVNTRKKMQRGRRESFGLEILESRCLMSATYYMATNGSDSAAGTSAAPFASLSKAYSVMKSGDTLILKDGTYNQQTVLSRTVRPPSGTAAAFTIVKAEHVGGAIIDGQNAMSPINMAGNPTSPVQYIQFDGLVIRHQATAGEVYGIDHVKFTQDGFENAAAGNNSTFQVDHSTYVLVEDCYAWGSGRYKFISYLSNNIVFRRDVARIDNIDAGGEPIAGIAIYSCNNVAVQNCIVLDGDQSQFWTNVGEYDGAYSIPSTNAASTNVDITGSIAVNVDLQFLMLTKNLSNITVSNSAGWHLREGVLARDSASFNHLTLGDLYGPARTTSTVGMQFSQGTDPVNSTALTNSILTGIKGTALTGWNSENYNDFYGNNANLSGTPSGANNTTANPALKYFLSTAGASSAIVGKASDGGDMGANITNEVGVSGTFYGDAGYNTVTGVALWPFPNETLIANMMRSYSFTSSAGTLSGNRGFAATGQSLTNYIWNYLGNGNPYAQSTSVPAAPSGLTATASGSTTINLAWTDNANNETGYVVQRQTNGGAWTQVASLAAGATSWADTGVAASTTYNYEVAAVNAAGTSAYSNVASATTAATVPATPSNLVAIPSGSSTINLTWTDNATNETGYIVQSQIGSGAWTQIASLAAGATSYGATGLAASTAYSFRVMATNSAGNSAFSNTATATTGAVAPAAPSGLTATASGTSAINLTWTNNDNNGNGYVVECQTGSGAWWQVTSLGVGANSYSATGLTASTSYSFRVMATGAGGNSPYSNVASATTGSAVTAPAAPSGLTATASGTSTINLAWTDNATNETGYVVQSQTGSGAWTQIATLAAGATSYSNTGLTAGTAYSYRVMATNSAGNSGYSNVATATTASVGTGPFQVFAAGSKPVNANDTDTAAVTLGMNFSSDVSGYVTAIRFYKGSQNTGTHIGYLWDANGKLLASATFSNETASGWQQVTLSTPVAITAGALYTVGYYAPNGHYAADANYFTSPVTSGPLHGANSAYIYAKGTYPKTNWQNSNYWVDAVVSTSLPKNLFQWNTNIGSPAKTGTASFNSSNNTYTVSGGGKDIWGASDQFNYDYTTKAGNSVMIAQVSSMANANSWSKAGIMFRDTTAANAMFADVVVTPGAGISFQYRTATGGSTNGVTIGGIHAPVWVKLVRSGNTFSGYYSLDGANWIQIGTTQTINMSATANAGLVVSAVSASSLVTATFANVSLA